MKRYLKIASIVLSLVLIVSVVAGCGSKSGTTTGTTPLQALSDQVNAMSSRLSAIETKVAGVDPNLRADITKLQADVAKIGTPKEVDLTPLQNRVSSLEARVTELEGLEASVPKYAMVTALRKKTIDITIYGTGAFSVAVTFYGSGLATGVVDVDDEDVAGITSEYIYGTYALIPGLVPQAVTGGPLTAGAISVPNPGDPVPNTHSHAVIVSGLTVPGYSLQFSGTQLVVIVTPEAPWTNGQVLKLDISGLAGVDYATAGIAVEE